MLRLQILLPLILLVIAENFDCSKICGRPVPIEFTCIKPENAREVLTPIILMHGSFLDRNSFENITETLKVDTAREVCTLDMRNHGQSPWSEMFNYDMMALDTFDLMDRKGFKKAIILGHSLGGKAAIVGSFIAPERVDKLIVEDIRPDFKSEDMEQALTAVIKIFNDSLKSVPGDFCEDEAKEKTLQYIYKRFDTEFTPFWKLLTDQLKERTKKILDCPLGICRFTISLEAALKSYKKINADYNGVYRGDALFIYGKKSDFGVPEGEKDILRQFPKAQFVGIEGANHLVHNDRPKEFLDAVIQFINGY